MGTWSANLFGNDIARDIRLDYPQYLRWGMTGRQATKKVLEDWADELQDTTQDAPVVWLALAVTQWNYGRLEPRVKKTALKIIKEGADIRSFPSELRGSRAKVLETIRVQLESPQPPEKRVRIAKLPKPSKATHQDWKAGQVFAYRRDSGYYLLLSTEVVTEHEYLGQLPHFLMLNWEGKAIPDAGTICQLPPIKFAMSGYPDTKGERIPWTRMERLEVFRDPNGYIVRAGGGVACLGGLHSFRWSEFERFLKQNKLSPTRAK